MNSRSRRWRFYASALGLALLLTCAQASAQRTLGEPSKTPRATSMPQWKAGGFPSGRVASLEYRELPAARILELEKFNSAAGNGPLQIGIARTAYRESPTAALPRPDWIVLKDGSSVGRIEIRSPLAMGLRVGLQVRGLDPRAELRFAGSDDPSRIVAIVSGERIGQLLDQKGVYWTPATDGQLQSIEIHLPASVSRRSVGFSAPYLSHLLANSQNSFSLAKGIGDSASCQLDTACRLDELGTGFANAKNAVAKMVFVSAIWYGETMTCSGTLLADEVAGSQPPYLYTNRQCISEEVTAATLNTYWNFEATSCGSNAAAATTLLTGGADIVYNSDWFLGSILLRLNDMAPAGAYFAGWDTTRLIVGTDIIGIHHPAGDLKKVALGKVREHSQYSGHELIMASWVSGVPETGSGGSGLFVSDAGEYLICGNFANGQPPCSLNGQMDHPMNASSYIPLAADYPGMSDYLSPAGGLINPVARFSYARAGLSMHFLDGSVDYDGTVSTYLWDFGDGTSSTEASPVKAYQRPGTYFVRLTVTDNDGLAHSRSRSVLVPVPAPNDFNGDGHSDILWRNLVTGQNAVWNSPNSESAHDLVTVTGLGWKIVGTGDFNGDGESDILWRDSATGTNVIWRSGEYGNQQQITGVTDLAWKIVGVGDFDGDGISDLLWRHDTSGRNTIWYSGNSSRKRDLATVTQAEWKVAGLGDFNGDGKADIQWHNVRPGSSASTNNIWLSGNYDNQLMQPPTASKSAHIGFFTLDTISDVMWRDSQGRIYVWAGGKASLGYALTSVPSPAWQIAAIGDYDSDGASDALWRNFDTGANAIWRSANYSTQIPVTMVTDLSWRIVSEAPGI